MESLSVLDELGAEFRRIGEPRARRVRLAHRTLVLAVLLGLLLVGAATAAILISSGAPLPAAHVQDLHSSGVPLPGSARLAGLDAPDPNGSAPAWDIRLSRTRAGETCSAVGQVLGGQFGIVGLDRVFRALPLGGVDSCGVDSPNGPVLAGARVFVAQGPAEARTVVNGVAGNGARSVTAYGPEGPRSLRLGPQGSFITVYRGYVEEVRPRIVVVSSDGRAHTIAFASSTAFESPDPAGGSPWEVSGAAKLEPGAYTDENCAQASRELGLSDPSHMVSSETPEVCGRLGRQPLFVSIRRFVPPDETEAHFSGVVPQGNETLSFPWGENPPRTLVYGAAAPRVAGLTLTGAGPARRLPIDPHGGLFIAVFDGHVDPRSLTLTARLRSGQTLTYTRSANLLNYFTNRPIPERPVPAYREPLPESATLPPPLETPLLATVHQTLRAVDPVGGPAWALRSWRGRPTWQGAGGRGSHEDSVCLEVGIVRGGVVVEPGLGSTGRPLSDAKDYDVRIGGCTQPRALDRVGRLLQVEGYVDEPFAYSPSPARTVVSGLLPAGAGDATLLGAGAPRRLGLDPNGAFLDVLPGRYWDALLHVSYRLHGRLVGTAAPPPAPATVPQARAPDPDGGAPWGLVAGPNCSTAIGRIIDGRLSSIDERSGTVIRGQYMTSSGGACFTRPGGAPRQIAVEISPVEVNVKLPGDGSESLTRPQLERRTLPGRTIIAGAAQADVASITLATPRDVRTLVPSGPRHAFIAVYDGQFFRGAIGATIHLRSGRDVTEALPYFGSAGSSAPPHGPALILRSVKRQIAEAESGSFPAPSAHARGRSLSAARRAELRRARLAPLENALRTIEDRIAYEHANPGVLPAE